MSKNRRMTICCYLKIGRAACGGGYIKFLILKLSEKLRGKRPIIKMYNAVDWVLNDVCFYKMIIKN